VFIRMLPIILLIIPIAEIAVFILVGQYIGLLPTLGLILATAVLGAALLRIQGFTILRSLSTEANAGRVPSRELVHGAMIVVAGILLITPGFITDCIGFLLFIPSVRDFIWSMVKSRMTVITRFTGPSPSGANWTSRSDQTEQGPVVDLDEDEFTRNQPKKSPWSGTTIERD